MSKYRKIDPRIWNDEHFRPLSDSAKLLFLFLLTHPHLTALGAMRATPAGLADELRWSEKRICAALEEISTKPFIKSATTRRAGGLMKGPHRGPPCDERG